MFMDNPELQERYYEAFVEANHKMLMTSDSYKNLSSDDKMGVLAYAQQGFGNAQAAPLLVRCTRRRTMFALPKDIARAHP